MLSIPYKIVSIYNPDPPTNIARLLFLKIESIEFIASFSNSEIL